METKFNVEEYLLKLIESKPDECRSPEVSIYHNDDYKYSVWFCHADNKKHVTLCIFKGEWTHYCVTIDDERIVSKIQWKLEDWYKYFQTCAINSFMSYVENGGSTPVGMDCLLDE